MSTALETKNKDQLNAEKECFWKEQSKLQKESGLSRKAWCRKHQLSYCQFGYWEHKWRHQGQSLTLLPVNVNSPYRINDVPTLRTMCTLVLKNGHALKIHDRGALQILLTQWG